MLKQKRLKKQLGDGYFFEQRLSAAVVKNLLDTYPGVDKAYAIQAGREVRIMVKPEVVSEDNMILLARDVAKKIEAELASQS